MAVEWEGGVKPIGIAAVQTLCVALLSTSK
jgi:hypothetical protein